MKCHLILRCTPSFDDHEISSPYHSDFTQRTVLARGANHKATPYKANRLALVRLVVLRFVVVVSITSTVIYIVRMLEVGGVIDQLWLGFAEEQGAAGRARVVFDQVQAVLDRIQDGLGQLWVGIERVVAGID